MNTQEKDRIFGCLYGQAIGDALGLGTEFMSRVEVKRNYPDGLVTYRQMVCDAHRRRWKAGEWTDDTEMMLCVMDSYQNGHFHPDLAANNFKRWFRGTPRGIGRHTYNVLCLDDYTSAPERAASIIWELNNRRNASNGAVMRTSVCGLPKNISDHETETICLLTHADPRCVASCVIIARVINSLVWQNCQPSIHEIEEIAGRYDKRVIPYVRLAGLSEHITDLNLDNEASMGYTLTTLSCALWALWHVTNFTDGLLQTVNAGGDADTNAAVTCSLLGAKFGFEAIPRQYKEGLVDERNYRRRCETFAERL